MFPAFLRNKKRNKIIFSQRGRRGKQRPLSPLLPLCNSLIPHCEDSAMPKQHYVARPSTARAVTADVNENVWRIPRRRETTLAREVHLKPRGVTFRSHKCARCKHTSCLLCKQIYERSAEKKRGSARGGKGICRNVFLVPLLRKKGFYVFSFYPKPVIFSQTLKKLKSKTIS